MSEDETVPHPTSSKPKAGLAVDLKGSEAKPIQAHESRAEGTLHPGSESR